jgi:hypothetical protein
MLSGRFSKQLEVNSMVVAVVWFVSLQKNILRVTQINLKLSY